MSRKRWHARPLLTAAVAALALIVSTPVLAQAGLAAGGDFGTTARADAYIRDTAAATGVEPNSFPEVWQSPDIKICEVGPICAESPTLEIGNTYTVWGRLRNPGPYGTGTVAGTVELFRTNPGGAAAWGTSDFVQVDRVPATAPAGGIVQVPLTFSGVPGPGHFCLVAVWVGQRSHAGSVHGHSLDSPLE